MAAVSVAWGAWGGTGMAAADVAVAARLRRVGIAAIQPAAGLVALERAVVLSVAAGSGTIMAASLVWERLLVDGRQHKPFYGEVAAVAAAAAQQQKGAAAPGDARVAVAVSHSRGGRPQSKASVAAAPQTAAPVSGDLPPWHAMSPAERTAYFAAEISVLVACAAGKAVGHEEPLLSAGLDSLGEWRCGGGGKWC